MTSTPRRRASMFVFETAASVLIFSLACALCVQLFVRAHNISRSSQDTMHALTLAQNAAELFTATETQSDFTGMLALKPISDGSFSAYLTPDTLPAANIDDGFYLRVDITNEENGLRRIHIEVARKEGEKALVSLDSTAYDPGIGGGVRD